MYQGEVCCFDLSVKFGAAFGAVLRGFAADGERRMAVRAAIEHGYLHSVGQQKDDADGADPALFQQYGSHAYQDGDIHQDVEQTPAGFVIQCGHAPFVKWLVDGGYK